MNIRTCIRIHGIVCDNPGLFGKSKNTEYSIKAGYCIKTLLHLLFAVMFLALTQSAEAVSGKQVVSGQVVFAVDYKQSVMEKNGYQFIGEGTYGEFITNYFGAQGADIVVKNGKGEIIGVGKTKSDGTFALTVDRSNFYQIAVEYRGRKIEKTISNTEVIKTIQIDLGRFNSRDFPEIKAMTNYSR